MPDCSKISLVSFPRKSSVAPVEASEPAEVEEADSAEGCDEGLAGVEDGFDVAPTRGQAAKDVVADFPSAEGAEAAEHLARADCILPKGRSLEDTVEAGRKALAHHIEQDLFAEGSDFPGKGDDELKEELLGAAEHWTPEDSHPFETFDPKEQSYEAELCGRPFTLTFTEGWKTARAMMNAEA